MTTPTTPPAGDRQHVPTDQAAPISTDDLREFLGSAMPGPWICYADLPSIEPNWHIIMPTSKIGVIANVHIEPENKRDAATARLIALTPEIAAEVLALRELVAKGGAA